MSITDTVVRTIACNACDRTVTYDKREEKQTFEAAGNEWLKSVRMVQTVDQRNFSYCSDECEVKGTTTGQHNLPEPKQVVEGNAAAVAMAAAAAKRQQVANEALRAGQNKIQVTD